MSTWNWTSPPLRQWIALLLFMFLAFILGYVMGGNAAYQKLMTEHKICAP
jgi:hypothetical protein